MKCPYCNTTFTSADQLAAQDKICLTPADVAGLDQQVKDEEVRDRKVACFDELVVALEKIAQGNYDSIYDRLLASRIASAALAKVKG